MCPDDRHEAGVAARREGIMNNRGFSLLELLIVTATLGIIAMIAIPLMESAMLRAHISGLATDAKAVHLAFKRFYIDQNKYPNASNSPAFNLSSFEPLVQMGYYDGRIVSKLADDQADGFDSPDDEGANQEFWLEITLKQDPSIRFLVVDSNNAPLSQGDYMDGIYFYRDGVLTPLANRID